MEYLLCSLSVQCRIFWIFELSPFNCENFHFRPLFNVEYFRWVTVHLLQFNCKITGADWRMLGERVGIPLETIQQWRRWKVENPAEYVLQSWGQSAGATVRMLHRHLISPQMSCIILAKRISDFYLVEWSKEGIWMKMPQYKIYSWKLLNKIPSSLKT